MFILFYLISNAWSAISVISNCKTLFPQSNKNPYHAKNTLLNNFYAIHYVSILLCQAIPLARLLLLLNAKKVNLFSLLLIVEVGVQIYFHPVFSFM